MESPLTPQKFSLILLGKPTISSFRKIRAADRTLTALYLRHWFQRYTG